MNKDWLLPCFEISQGHPLEIMDYFPIRPPPLTRSGHPRNEPNRTILLKSAQKKPPTCANMLVVRKIPGVVLLSHSQISSTIAAGALNCRVREGNECFCSAMDPGKYKTKKKILIRKNQLLKKIHLFCETAYHFFSGLILNKSSEKRWLSLTAD